MGTHTKKMHSIGLILAFTVAVSCQIDYNELKRKLEEAQKSGNAEGRRVCEGYAKSGNCAYGSQNSKLLDYLPTYWSWKQELAEIKAGTSRIDDPYHLYQAGLEEKIFGCVAGYQDYCYRQASLEFDREHDRFPLPGTGSN